jgi:hypothetical protein
MTAATVTLYARRWVRLPGTGWDVYLHGKSGALTLHRNGGPWGGWSLPESVYVRPASDPEAES